MVTTAPRRRLAAVERRALLEQAAVDVFAERGYRAATIAEIARRAGVSVPIVYDHFASKQAIYRDLIERHYADLRSIWFEASTAPAPLGPWLAGAVDRWFAYVEQHPFAGRMLFHDTTGDPDIAAMHQAIQDASRGALLPLLAAALDVDDELEVELVWETIRAILQGLAVWWHRHPDVDRGRIVATAMDALWTGLERVAAGERYGRIS